MAVGRRARTRTGRLTFVIHQLTTLASHAFAIAPPMTPILMEAPNRRTVPPPLWRTRRRNEGLQSSVTEQRNGLGEGASGGCPTFSGGSKGSVVYECVAFWFPPSLPLPSLRLPASPFNMPPSSILFPDIIE